MSPPTDATSATDGTGATDETRSAVELRAHRRRLAEVFGDVIPEQTSDDLAEESPDQVGSDAWLRAQVPPHHGS